MPADLTPLFNLGAIGCVLGWFLWKSEPRMERIERAIDRLTRGMMLELVARPEVSEPIKEQARSLIREIDRSAGKESSLP